MRTSRVHLSKIFLICFVGSLRGGSDRLSEAPGHRRDCACAEVRKALGRRLRSIVPRFVLWVAKGVSVEILPAIGGGWPASPPASCSTTSPPTKPRAAGRKVASWGTEPNIPRKSPSAKLALTLPQWQRGRAHVRTPQRLSPAASLAGRPF